MSSLQQEFESVNDDRMRLSDDMDEMKKKLQAAQTEKEAAQRKYTKEVSLKYLYIAYNYMVPL